MSEALRIERRPPLFEVTLDRPKANAIDAATSRAMGQAFTEFRDDAAYRVAILTGAGERFFSAGWDLHAAAEGEGYDADFGPGGFGGFPELPRLVKPVICAVNGLAVGGGFEMVLAAHLVVAADYAEFALPEATVGLIADIGSVLLPRAVPGPVAREMLLTGRRMGAEEAARWGLVNRVVPGTDLLGAARQLAEEVVAAAPLAVEATLDLLHRMDGLPAGEALRLLRFGDVESVHRVLSSEDAREGARAFVEKRPPRWSGR